jgi:hypothetical protein
MLVIAPLLTKVRAIVTLPDHGPSNSASGSRPKSTIGLCTDRGWPQGHSCKVSLMPPKPGPSKELWRGVIVGLVLMAAGLFLLIAAL